MNKQPSYYTYAFAIIFLLILTLFLDSTIGSRIVTVITVSTAVLGAVSIFVQYKRDTKQPIINEDESLEKVENYMQYVNKGDLSNKQTF